MANIIKETSSGYSRIAIEDELLGSREIFLVDGVNDVTSSELIKQLMYLEREAPGEEITFYINSPGGIVQSGLAVYDYIMLMKSPVKTVCIGDAASMGAILFLAGEKREMLPHTRIMIHDPSYSSFDMGGRKPHEIQREVDKLNKVREITANIISERTGKPLETVYKATAEDSFFSAEEAIEYGLATGIYKGV